MLQKENREGLVRCFTCGEQDRICLTSLHCVFNLDLFQGVEGGCSFAPPVEQGEGEQEEADQGRIPPGQCHHHLTMILIRELSPNQYHQFTTTLIIIFITNIIRRQEKTDQGGKVCQLVQSGAWCVP